MVRYRGEPLKATDFHASPELGLLTWGTAQTKNKRKHLYKMGGHVEWEQF